MRLSGPIKLVIHHDPAARITIDDLGRIAAADSIIFDLSVGDEQQACLIAESRELLGADAPGFLRQDHSSDAGSSDDCTVESKSPGDFVIPKHIILGLQYALARVFEQEAIWLSLQAPYGFLPLVPWEQLLVPELKRRIFRVSPAPKSVPVSRIRGNIALCFCPPDYLEFGRSGAIARLLSEQSVQLEQLRHPPTLRIRFTGARWISTAAGATVEGSASRRNSLGFPKHRRLTWNGHSRGRKSLADDSG